MGNDPSDYSPDIPLGDMEVAYMINKVAEELREERDREKARRSLQEIVDRHLTREGEGGE